MTTADLASVLRNLRDDLTLREAAAATGEPRATISRWEHGNDLDQVARVLSYLERIGAELTLSRRAGQDAGARYR